RLDPERQLVLGADRAARFGGVFTALDERYVVDPEVERFGLLHLDVEHDERGAVERRPLAAPALRRQLAEVELKLTPLGLEVQRAPVLVETGLGVGALAAAALEGRRAGLEVDAQLGVAFRAEAQPAVARSVVHARLLIRLRPAHHRAEAGAPVGEAAAPEVQRAPVAGVGDLRRDAAGAAVGVREPGPAAT